MPGSGPQAGGGGRRPDQDHGYRRCARSGRDGAGATFHRRRDEGHRRHGACDAPQGCGACPWCAGHSRGDQRRGRFDRTWHLPRRRRRPGDEGSRHLLFGDADGVQRCAGADRHRQARARIRSQGAADVRVLGQGHQPRVSNRRQNRARHGFCRRPAQGCGQGARPDGQQGRNDPARRLDRRDQGRGRPARPVERDGDPRSRQVGRPDCSRGRPVGRSGRGDPRRLCHGPGQSDPDERRPMTRTSLFALALALSSAPAVAQNTPAGDAPSKEAKAEAAKPNPDQVKASVEEDAQPVKRSISLRGRTLAYTVTPGHLTVRNADGEPTASMFYTAYTAPSARRPRPVTFLFTGGPGSSTIWLPMGSFGPIKVDASNPETIAGPPFRYGPNPDTLLDVSDLVFIDAPTTGLSRALGKAEPKDFFGVDKDLDVFTRTIQRYLTKYGRWNSPKFIIGESYGAA